MRAMHDLPDLELLRCFQHLHKEQHLTRAARRVGLSQPAMSRALGRLREAFDDPLFVKTPRGMLPTPRAEQLAPQVHALLDAAAALARPAAFDPARVERPFAIGCTDFLDAVMTPRLVEALLAQAPRATVTTRPFGEDAADGLATGRLDVVIGVRSSVPADAVAALLFEDPFVCAVREGHPTVGARLSLDAFCALPHLLISPRGAPGSPVDTALDAVGRARRVVARVASFLAAPVIISRTDLVLTAPARVLEPLAPRFGLRLLPPPVALPPSAMWMAWHPRVHDDPAHAWFRGLVAAAARGDDGGADGGARGPRRGPAGATARRGAARGA